MSEQLKTNPPALCVAAVEPGSAAARAGIQPGDLLREVNGRAILDILDYRFHAADERLKMVIERDGELKTVSLRNRDGDPGLEFSADLADKIHTCVNKCVFCFIHQMPKKMRRSLYLMDDDFRLSFMHGNYVTLTNLSEAEWQRILEQRLSPLYVSVHTTDPVLRGQLLGKPAPAPILEPLRRLAEHRISVHAQIVLCPGLNDGEALWRTLDELATLHPAESGLRAGVESVAIVPVGLTRFRDRLPKLTMADQDYARQMIADVEAVARKMRRRLGTRYVWLSDEWYFQAKLPIPGTSHYEEFPQLEDGVGTVRLFLDDAKALERRLPAEAKEPIRATLVTAELPAEVVRGFADRLNRIEGVDLNVCVVKNNFFGGGIDITGLLTANDIGEQLAEFPTHDTVYIPNICLRDEQVFLDDLTVEDLRRTTGKDIRPVGIKPRDLVLAMGLIGPGRRQSLEPGRWIIEEAP